MESFVIYFLFTVILLYILYRLNIHKNIKNILINNTELSNNLVNDSALSNINYQKINNKPVVNIIRNNDKDVTGENHIYYEPKYITKDNMLANDIGSTEYTFAQFPDDKASKAWVDYDISQNPKFYKSNFKNELLNTNNLFDNQKIYRNTSKQANYYKNKIINIPACYESSNNTNVCNFNGKLKEIPTSLSDITYNDLYYPGDDFLNYKYMNGEYYKGNIKGWSL